MMIWEVALLSKCHDPMKAATNARPLSESPLESWRLQRVPSWVMNVPDTGGDMVSIPSANLGGAGQAPCVPAKVIQPACRLVDAGRSKTSQRSFWIPWEKGPFRKTACGREESPQLTHSRPQVKSRRQNFTDFSKPGSSLCFGFLAPLCFGFLLFPLVCL